MLLTSVPALLGPPLSPSSFIPEPAPSLGSINPSAQPVDDGPIHPQCRRLAPPALPPPFFKSSFAPRTHEALPALSSPLPSLFRRPKILLPCSNQKKLIREIDSDLLAAMESHFPPHWFESAPLDEVGLEFELFLFNFLLERCGSVPLGHPKAAAPSSKRRPHRHRKLRRVKNRLKKIMAHHRKRNQLAEYAKARAEYSKISRQLSLLNKLLRLNEERNNAVRAQVAFNKDRFKYTKRLFDPASSSYCIDKSETESYFNEAYSDSSRSFSFSPPPNLPRPPPPTFPLEEPFESFPVFMGHLKKKSSGFSAGPYGVQYKVYKTFPCAAKKLFLLCKRCKRERRTPSSWGHAFMILLTKKNRPTNHAKHLRNIACASTAGKMFWSGMLSSLLPFLLENKYIDPSINKGGLPGVPGCLEHSWSFAEALRNAKHHKRQIVATITDIVNAYGTTKHNLIQFALAWYHVPPWFADIVFFYYDQLVAFVNTPDWDTSPFRYGIGVFQGCVIAMYLFILCYQLVIDFLKHSAIQPYTFKSSFSPPPSILQQAFVDDHKLLNCATTGAQFNLDLLCTILDWTKCFRLKPSGCYCFALGDRRAHGGSSYGVFDPLLKIGNEIVNFLGDDLHKLLGRLISSDASDKGAYAATVEFFTSALDTVDAAPLSGPSKAWIYQFYILAVLSWPFLIYPFSISNIAGDFEAPAARFLKKWYGLARPANPAVLFLPKSHSGLGLTSPVEHFKVLQVSAFHQLSHSSDPLISSLAASKSVEELRSAFWKPSKALSAAESIIDFNLKFGGHAGTAGLGFNPKKRKRKPGCSHLKERRAAISASIRSDEADSRVATLRSRPLSGNFLTWEDLAPSVLNWNNQILRMSEKQLSFLLNAQAQTLPDASNLRRWNCNATARCVLCGLPAATAKHTLSHCYIALIQGRFSWRHDNVLSALEPHVRGRVAKVNRSDPVLRKPIRFLPAGCLAPCRRWSRLASPSLLCCANDWEVQFDFDGNLVFPSVTGVTTALRPDIVIWSPSKKVIIWGELTCPLEERFLESQVIKLSRYMSLEIECRVRGWATHAFPFEVGCLGFVSNSSRKFLLALGISKSELKWAIWKMSEAARKSSCHIWHSRRNSKWIGPPLVPRKTSPQYDPSPPASSSSPCPAPLLPLPPPPFPPPFHLLPSSLQSKILENKKRALALRAKRKHAERVQKEKDDALLSRFERLCDNIDVELDAPVRPRLGAADVQLDELGWPVPSSNPNLRLWPTCVEPCISNLSLKDMPLSEINRLWFDDIKKKRLADPLSGLNALMRC